MAHNPVEFKDDQKPFTTTREMFYEENADKIIGPRGFNFSRETGEKKKIVQK